MNRVLSSIGVFLICFAAGCLTFAILTGGAITIDRYIVAAIIGLLAGLRVFLKYTTEEKTNEL